jgi:hypothetical protein
MNKKGFTNSIERIEKEIVNLGYVYSKEFLDIVESTSKGLDLNVVKNNIDWATYQERKNGDILCYTHIYSTINTNQKPTSPAPWMSPSSPLPDYVYLTFKYFFDFTFNTKTNEIKNLKVGYHHHNHQMIPSPKHFFNIQEDKNIKDSLIYYVKNCINSI